MWTFSSFGYWSEIVTPTTEDLNKIEIINNTAFCIGSNGILLKGTNLGETWTVVSTSATGNLTSIQFTNNSTGYFTTGNGKVYKSTNGGGSWTAKNVHEGGLNTIDFLNTSIGITAGDNGVLYKTTNGGSSWNSLGSQSIYAINDVAFINDTLVVAVGPNGSLLYSTDVGESWVFLNTNTTEVFNAIEKKNNSTAVIVGSNGSYTEFNAANLSIGGIAKVDITGDWLRDVHVTEKSDGYTRTVVVGYSSSYHIENFGWNKWDLDSMNNLTGIHFFNDTVGIICGHHGKIYKTTSGGVPHFTPTVLKESLAVYPNPVASSLFISKNFHNQQVSIYSTSSELVLQKKLTGNQLNVESLSPGPYIIQLSIENIHYTGRFIKQ